MMDPVRVSVIFFFNTPATTEIYTLSLHDALPIRIAPANSGHLLVDHPGELTRLPLIAEEDPWRPDRKSTRLNSSHVRISYAVFCLKKKKYTTLCSQTSQIPKTAGDVASSRSDSAR